jgi:anti-repressor protein
MSFTPTTALATVTPPSDTFRFPDTGHAIRTVLVDGEPWFVGADVCAVLGHAHTGSALRMLDPDERQTMTFPRSSGVLSEHTAADQRIQKLAVVSESGLFSLILRSQVPGAAAFRRWVTHDVLPAIRRTGRYGTEKLSPRELAQLVLAEADRADLAEQRVVELEPAADAWESLAAAGGDYSLRDAAHVLNRDPAISTGQNRLLRFLRDEQMVDRKGVPYVKYARLIVERPVSYNHPHTGDPVLTTQIRITTDGLAYLRRRLGGIRGASASGKR